MCVGHTLKVFASFFRFGDEPHISMFMCRPLAGLGDEITRPPSVETLGLDMLFASRTGALGKGARQRGETTKSAEDCPDCVTQINCIRRHLHNDCMKLILGFLYLCFLSCAAGLSQTVNTAQEFPNSLEKHAFVLRHNYTDPKLTFDSSGQIITSAKEGFGPSDGTVYVLQNTVVA